MDRLISIPDRDSIERVGGNKAYAIKHRFIYFNPYKGLALRLKIMAYFWSTDVFNC
jgi:hypothetical protein